MEEAYVLKGPTLCLVVGVAGTGKTRLAKRLQEVVVNSSYLSKDMIQDAFTAQRTGDAYEEVSGPTFDVLLKFCSASLKSGKHPLIDAPYSNNHNRTDKYKRWVELYKEVAEKNNARLAIIRCIVPNEGELKKRLRNRVERGEYPWDKEKLDNWERFIKKEPMNFPIDHHNVLELDTTRSDEVVLEKALSFLGGVRVSFEYCS